MFLKQAWWSHAHAQCGALVLKGISRRADLTVLRCVHTKSDAIFFAWPNPMKSQRTDACGCDRRDILGRLGRRVFSGAIFALSWNISTLRRSSRNSGQSALDFRSRSAGSGSLSGVTVTSSVKVTALSEPTGDVMNPNTRALVCGMSTTNIKQN